MLVTKDGIPFYLISDQRGLDTREPYYKITAYTLGRKEIGFLTYLLYKDKKGDLQSWVYQIITHVDYLDKGVGHALICAYEQECRKRGVKKFEGKFSPDGKGAVLARPFYERHGVKIINTEDDQFIMKDLNNNEKVPPVREIKDFKMTF